MAANPSYDPAAINAATDIAALVARYVTLKARGNEFIGRCIWHSPDEHPSMCVVPSKRFVHCHACGSHADAIGFLQQVEGIDEQEACKRLTNGGGDLPPAMTLPVRELLKAPTRKTFAPPADAPPPDMAIKALGEPVKVWTYRTPDGATVGYVARYADEDGRKNIRPWTWGCRSEADPQRWECGAFSAPRPLYGIEHLHPKGQVMLVEGEKAADAAASLLPELSVLTWPGGAGAVRYADWSLLAGRSVVIWPDNDDAGAEAAGHLVTALRKAGAARIKVLSVDTILRDGVEIPTPEGWDAADAAASMWTPEQTWAWCAKRANPDLAAPQQIESDLQGEAAEGEVTANLPSVEAKGNSGDMGGLPLSPPTIATPVVSDPEPLQGPQSDANGPGDSRSSPPPSNVRHIAAGKAKPRRRAAGNAVPQPDPEDDAIPAAYSQDALAQELFAKAGADWRHVSVLKQWYHWTGFTWQPQKTNKIFKTALEHCREAAANDELSPSLRRSINNRTTAADVVTLLSWDQRVAITDDVFDRDIWLLGTPEGVIDLRTGEYLPANEAREKMTTQMTAAAPEDGEPELWMRCLRDWTEDSPALMDYIHRLAGYCLTGSTREQLFAFVHGVEGTGKSKLITTIGRVMGKYSANAEMETFTESKYERHSSEFARLKGKRLVYAAETQEGRRWNEALIKKCAGEDLMTARLVYENASEFQPVLKLIVYGNNHPTLSNPDGAFARRLKVIPMNAKVPADKIDKKLDDKLVPEYGRILKWMMQGCLLWQRDGMPPPAIVVAEVDSYMDSQDTFGDWISECIERAPGAREKSGDLYRSYRAFIESHGESPVSQKRFAPKLEGRGFWRIKTGGLRMFVGGTLRAAPPPMRTPYAD